LSADQGGAWWEQRVVRQPWRRPPLSTCHSGPRWTSGWRRLFTAHRHSMRRPMRRRAMRHMRRRAIGHMLGCGTSCPCLSEAFSSTGSRMGGMRRCYHARRRFRAHWGRVPQFGRAASHIDIHSVGQTELSVVWQGCPMQRARQRVRESAW
jgi:hypothetical protein